MAGMNKILMASYNRIMVMKLLYRYEKLSIKELTQKMKLTISAISKIVRKLQKEDFITLSSEFVHCTGNHQGLWCINKDLNFFLCINISSTMISSFVVDSLGNCLDIPKEEDIKFFKKNKEECLFSHFLYWQTLFAGLKYASISFNRSIKQDKSDSTEEASLTSLAAVLEVRLGIKIKLENSCYTMSLSEKWLGSGHSKSFIFILVDEDVEAINIISDNFYNESVVIPIQLGHMTVTAKSKVSHGSRNSLVEYVGNKYLCEKNNSSSIEQFYTSLKNGDSKTLLVYKEAKQMLGIAIGNIINLFSPDKIIFEGSFIQENELTPLIEEIKKSSLPYLFENCYINKTRLTTEQVMAGSAFLWIEEFLKNSSTL